jgi:hypothetical protein
VGEEESPFLLCERGNDTQTHTHTHTHTLTRTAADNKVNNKGIQFAGLVLPKVRNQVTYWTPPNSVRIAVLRILILILQTSGEKEI